MPSDRHAIRKHAERLERSLRSSPEGRPWAVGLVERILRYGVGTIVRAGRRSSLTIRFAVAGEGEPGELVAELEEGNERRVIANERGPTTGQPSSGNRERVRTLRMSDELHARACRHGTFAEIVRQALTEYLDRRNLP